MNENPFYSKSLLDPDSKKKNAFSKPFLFITYQLLKIATNFAVSILTRL